jgi:uncharacterized protein YeaO (DUF488 family)
MLVDTSRSTAGIVIKHISALPEPGDGKRILVNRLWPRSASKEDAALNEWHPEWAPSWPLRTWFAFRGERWDEFCRRYRLELETRGKLAEFKALAEAAKSQRVTLVFTGSNLVHNVGAALQRIIAES